MTYMIGARGCYNRRHELVLCNIELMTPAQAWAGGRPGAQPLYKEVKNRITRSLIAGEWKPGAAIPSETELASRFAVSIGTIRRAIDELVAEKIVVRRQGRGTYVSIHTEDRQFYYFFHIVGKDGGKEPPLHELLSLRTTKADVETAAQLGIEPNTPVHRIYNVLKLEGEPVIYDEIRVAARRFGDLDAALFRAREGTIYGLYQARFGINVVRISERLSAAAAPARVARVLGVAKDSPLLVIKRVAYTYHDEPVELRTSWVDTEEHEYLSDLWKSEPR